MKKVSFEAVIKFTDSDAGMEGGEVVFKEDGKVVYTTKINSIFLMTTRQGGGYVRPILCGKGETVADGIHAAFLAFRKFGDPSGAAILEEAAERISHDPGPGKCQKCGKDVLSVEVVRPMADPPLQ